MKKLILGSMTLLLAGCTANARFDLTEIKDQPNSAPASMGAALGEARIGQPEVSAWNAKRSQSQSATEAKFVYVGEGETLESIARSRGVTSESLMTANNLSTNRVEPGRYLIVPSPGAPR